MKRWIKYGIIFLVVEIVLFIILMTGTFTCSWNPVEGSVIRSGVCQNVSLIVIFYLIPGIIFLALGGISIVPIAGISSMWIIGLIVPFIISFLIGALIGFIVEKIVNRKKK